MSALNRAGVTMYEARHVRPAWEVEALLVSAVSEAEARRAVATAQAEAESPVIPNPEGEPAPDWVMELPTSDSL